MTAKNMSRMTNTVSSKPSLSPRHPPPFTPIQEYEKHLETEEDVWQPHPPTPHPQQLPEASKVSCIDCRPTRSDKINIVPLTQSPNGVFKSIITSFTKKSPATATPETRWQAVATNLSRKVTSANKKRDEAVLEASRLKYSMAELERKLNKLEMYCHDLKADLDKCREGSKMIVSNPNDKMIGFFLASVSEARTSLRTLSRALAMQLRQMGPKVYDSISVLLNPYDVKISNSRALVYYIEALLNRAFFKDFESVVFEKSAPNLILNPLYRSERNFTSFSHLKDLSWEEVLSKGTKHFSEEFSRFCDRKMSEIVTMLGWNRAWPEPLLQAFFNGSKSVWLVHLLANSIHPSLPIFRVDKGVKFDPVYMEDSGEANAGNLVPSQVRIMVTPGFYVGNNVVKCKVLCRYHGGFSDKGLSPSPI